MGGRTPVSAVVATMCRPELLEGCVAALVATLTAGDQLIVAEAGGDSAGEILGRLVPEEIDAVHLLVDPPGKCRQLNAALRAAARDVVLFTDDDVRVTPAWADGMSEPFGDPSVGLACGRVQGLSGVPGVAADPGPAPGDAPLETWRFAHGAAMAVRRRAAFEAGGFDERLGPGTPAPGEDHDFVLRVREKGWRVVVAQADTADHLGWRSAEEDRANALTYEKGGGAIVGAALRRSRRTGLPLLRSRLAYQRSVFEWNRGFGFPALRAFATGVLYGIRLGRRDWIAVPSGEPGGPVLPG